MNNYYACFGQTGVAVLTSYGVYEKLHDYFGKYNNCRKFYDLAQAEAYAIGQYNALNSNYPEAQYHGSLVINKALYRRKIKQMNEELQNAPIDLVSWR